MNSPSTMRRLHFILLAGLLLPTLSWALPVVRNPTVGNVRTTGFALCWETTEPAEPGLRIFTNAAGTEEITAEVLIDYQSLTSERREVGSTSISRAATRQLQSAMDARNLVLTQVSGLQPDTPYWVRAQTLDSSGEVFNQSPLLPLTTPARAAFIVESRQLIVDLSGVGLLLGDLSGVVVRLSNPDSPYPLFAVLNDGFDGLRSWFDLNHFLDPSGETNLVTQAGQTLDLTISFLGPTPVDGTFSGNQVTYDGSAQAAGSSTVTFTPEGITVAAFSSTPTALLGQTVALRLEANDINGTPLPNFERSLELTSPAFEGGSLTSHPLTHGLLAQQDIIFNSLGPQTVTITDPASGANTSVNFNVIAYTYPNFRVHYYGDLTNPLGNEDQNGDHDPFNNFLEFAFGLNPLVSNGDLQLDPSYGVLKRGGPATAVRIDTVNGTDIRVTFLRSRDRATLGLVYAPEFSANMVDWLNSPNEPTILTTHGDMELVSLEYPTVTPSDTQTHYFRVTVTLVP